jgi:hypothetical protein
MLFSCLVIVLSGLLLPGSLAPRSTAEEGVERLSGEWESVWGEMNGKRVKWILILSSDGYEVDPTTNPPRIEFSVEENTRIIHYRGIFLRQRDRLKLCIRERSRLWPTRFATKPKSGLFLFLLKPIKPK